MESCDRLKPGHQILSMNRINVIENKLKDMKFSYDTIDLLLSTSHFASQCSLNIFTWQVFSEYLLNANSVPGRFREEYSM